MLWTVLFQATSTMLAVTRVWLHMLAAYSAIVKLFELATSLGLAKSFMVVRSKGFTDPVLG